MPIETGDKIEDLNELWPLGSDPKSEGDDHFRLVKKVLKTDAASLSADNAFAGAMTVAGGLQVRGETDVKGDLTIETSTPTLKLVDQDTPVGGSLGASIRWYASDGTEVGHVGRRSSGVTRLRSNDGPILFEADLDSLAATEASNPFVFQHRSQIVAKISKEGQFESSRLRLTSDADVSLPSTGHPFQIGNSSGRNVAMDNNEIQARENFSAGTLGINIEGGDVNIGNNSSVTALRGRATIDNGSSGAPSLCFASDTDTGIYRGSSDLLCVTGGGSLRGRFDAAGPSIFNKDTVINREKGDNRYQAKSSKRFKEKIGEVAIGTSSILDLMQPKSFVWGGELPDSAEEKGCAAFGLIAEEVERFFPEAVTYQWHNPKQTKDANGEEKSDVGGPKRVLGLDPLALIGVLIDEVKALKSRVSELEGGSGELSA